MVTPGTSQLADPRLVLTKFLMAALRRHVAGVNPSYTQTNYNSTIGKLRIRYSGDHSAVTTYDGKFISKWGPGPLVKHNALDVPPGYGNPSTCWTCKYAP